MHLPDIIFVAAPAGPAAAQATPHIQIYYTPLPVKSKETILFFRPDIFPLQIIPRFPIEAAVLDRLAEVFGLDPVAAGKVCDRPADP